MTFDQIAVSAILLGALVLFAWSRWRFDVVAMMALSASVLVGVVEAEAAFEGFAHPAVMTVAAVLIVSRGIAASGLVDRLAGALARLALPPKLRIAALCAVAAAISGFMNNVGALALLMPVALAIADEEIPPGRILMPLSFCAILGGLTTLIGTPPNLIVSEFRAETEAPAFGLFDFAPVGGAVALAGVLFVTLVAGRLTPWRRGASKKAPGTRIGDYLAEVRIPPEADAVGLTVEQVSARTRHPLRVVGLIRGGAAQRGEIAGLQLREEDVLLVRGDVASLQDVIEDAGLELASDAGLRDRLRAGGLNVMEAVVPPRSRLQDRSPRDFRLTERFGVRLLAVARQGRFLRDRLRDLVFQPGDVVLLHGDSETLSETVTALELLPLSGADPLVARRAWLPALIFAAAIGAIVTGLAPPAFALMMAALVMVLTGSLTLHMAYDALDLPVLVLLGAMLPVGGALETTGMTGLIADAILRFAGEAPLRLVLLFVMVVTMTLSDLMNNAATAVVMAPIATSLAQRMGVDPDPLLMGVAVAASCAFLTPIGHQNNALVMGPGGYRFGDYWRLGLPLELVILAVATLLIPLVWSW